MAQFTRFKPTRDAFLFGWAVLGEDFLGATPTPTSGPGLVRLAYQRSTTRLVISL